MAALALVVTFTPVLAPALALPLLFRFADGASSHSSRAPSSRIQAAGLLGRGVVRLRSRSSKGRVRPPRRPVAPPTLAPRRATLPHFRAWPGRGRSPSRGGPAAGLSRAPSPVRVLARRGAWPLARRGGAPVSDPRSALGAPVLVDPLIVPPVLGAPGLRVAGCSSRARPPLPCLRFFRGEPVLPRAAAPPRDEDRLEGVRLDGVRLDDPPDPLDLRRAPPEPRVSPTALEAPRVRGRPWPPSFAPLAGLAGLAGLGGREPWARRSGRDESGGISGLYAPDACGPGRQRRELGRQSCARRPSPP